MTVNFLSFYLSISTVYIDFLCFQQKSGRNLHIYVKSGQNSGCVLKLVRRLNKGFSPLDPSKTIALVHPPMIILSHETHKTDQKYNPKEGTGFFQGKKKFFDLEMFSCFIESLLFFWSL